MRFNECMCWYLKPFLGQRDDLKKKKKNSQHSMSVLWEII